MTKDTKKLIITTQFPTYSDFIECFNKGLQMGDIINPDRAIAHSIVQEIMSNLKQEWLAARAGYC
jgi:hypothetical protein